MIMASRIVYKPDDKPHVCRPGWTTRELPLDDLAQLVQPGARALVAPTPWDFPPGTVVECECTKTYVSEGARYANAPGLCYFRREGWFERIRRERRALYG